MARIVSEADLESLPPFLRFERVDLWFVRSEIERKVRVILPSTHHPSIEEIEETCEQFNGQLQVLEPSLIGTKLIFWGDVDRWNDCGSFDEHSRIVDYLSHSIVYRPRCFPYIHSENMTALNSETNDFMADIIASILQTPEVDRCSHVEIMFSRISQQTNLPVKIISDWLNRTPNEMKIVDGSGKQNERRILQIDSVKGKLQNLREVFEGLKQVGTYNPSQKSSDVRFEKIGRPICIWSHSYH